MVCNEKPMRQKHGLTESCTQDFNIEANIGIWLKLYLQTLFLKVIPKEDGCRCLTTKTHNVLSIKVSGKTKWSPTGKRMVINEGHYTLNLFPSGQNKELLFTKKQIIHKGKTRWPPTTTEYQAKPTKPNPPSPPPSPWYGRIWFSPISWLLHLSVLSLSATPLAEPGSDLPPSATCSR